MVSGIMQLVGQKCVLCGERISSIVEGRFCSACDASVHDKCAAPSMEGGRCSTCGAPAAFVAQALKREGELLQSRARQVKQNAAIKLLVGGWLMCMIAVGATFTSLGVTGSIRSACLIAFGIGVLMFIRGLVAFMRRRK